MTIASEITRLSGLRDAMRGKLLDLGALSNANADLAACSAALATLSPGGGGGESGTLNWTDDTGTAGGDTPPYILRAPLSDGPRLILMHSADYVYYVLFIALSAAGIAPGQPCLCLTYDADMEDLLSVENYSLFSTGVHILDQPFCDGSYHLLR